MKLRCVVGMRSKSEIIATDPAVLAKQGDMLMDSAFQALMEDSKTSNLFRLRPSQSIDKMVRAEDGKLGDETDDDACGGESGTNEEGSESEEQEAALKRRRSSHGFGSKASPSGIGAQTPKKGVNMDGSREGDRSTSGAAAQKQDADSEEEDFVADDLGTWPQSHLEPSHTMGHWIMEMPPEEAMLGDAQGRQQVQIANLRVKETTSENDKRRAIIHTELIEHARKMREGVCELLDTSNYALAVKCLAAAGRCFPSRIRLTQVRRMLFQADKQLKDTGSDARVAGIMAEIVQRCQVWSLPEILPTILTTRFLRLQRSSRVRRWLSL